MPRTIRFPVTYKVHGMLPGRQQPRSYVFAEFVDLDLVSADKAEAPVAVSWRVARDPRIDLDGGRRHWDTDVRGRNGRQYTRYFEGRHWFPMEEEETSDGYRYSEPLETDDFLTGFGDYRYNAMFGLDMPTMGAKPVELVGGDPAGRFGTVTHHGREAAMAISERLRFLSVGGNLYVACDQPVYRLARARPDGFIPLVNVRERVPGQPTDWKRERYLPLSMPDEVARACGPCFRYLEDAGFPEVHLPESMSRDEDMRVAADFFVREFMVYAKTKPAAVRAGISDYFLLDDAAARLDYLLDYADSWPTLRTRWNCRTELLERAIELLESRSIDFGQRVLGSGPTP